MSTHRFDEDVDLRHGGRRGRFPNHDGKKIACFIAANAALAPLILSIYATVNAEGLTVFQPIFGMPIYRIAGLSWVAQYAGWNQVTLGHITACGLLLLLNGVWCWVIRHLRDVGGAAVERTFEGHFFRFKAVLAGAAILIETAIFFAGLVAVGGGLWGGGAWGSAALFTVLYLIGMGWIADWHTNFRYGGPKV